MMPCKLVLDIVILNICVVLSKSGHIKHLNHDKVCPVLASVTLTLDLKFWIAEFFKVLLH